MPRTDQCVDLRLLLPAYIYETLSGWARSELEAEPEVVLAALAEEICRNGDLRAYIAALMEV